MNASQPVSAPSQRRKPAPSATWTTERVELLRNYAQAGFTCMQIARQIGVTRNAVIGKLNRLGLSQPTRSTARTDGADASPLRRPGAPTQRQILRAVHAETPFAGAAAPEPVVASAQRCTLLELTHGKCRWPVSEPDAKDFSFCGNAAVAGLSYCAGHARIAYRGPAQRRA
jgi:GcrA cell cycle regulator